MSKICPNCHVEYNDKYSFCPDCGTRLIGNTVTKKSKRTMKKSVTSSPKNNRKGDKAENISGENISTGKVRTIQKAIKPKSVIADKTSSSKDTAAHRKRVVKAKAIDDELSKNLLKSVKQSIEDNSGITSANMSLLATIFETTKNEEFHFYYSMLLAAFDPKQCVKLYNSHKYNSYWLAYWTRIAYVKLKTPAVFWEAGSELDTKWSERPKINAVINDCIGSWTAPKWDLGKNEEKRNKLINRLSQSVDAPSEVLMDLYQSLLCKFGIVKQKNPQFAFYNEHFFAFKTKVEFSNISIKSNGIDALTFDCDIENPPCSKKYNGYFFLTVSINGNVMFYEVYERMENPSFKLYDNIEGRDIYHCAGQIDMEKLNTPSCKILKKNERTKLNFVFEFACNNYSGMARYTLCSIEKTITLSYKTHLLGSNELTIIED